MRWQRLIYKDKIYVFQSTSLSFLSLLYVEHGKVWVVAKVLKALKLRKKQKFCCRRHSQSGVAQVDDARKAPNV